MMRKIIFHFFLLFVIAVQAQQHIAFSFGETPQTLMLNPGSETNYKSHYGIPVLSNFQLTIGNTGFQMGDLFSNDSRSFNEKFEKVINQLEPDDYINLNTKIDVLSFGYRYNNKTYISLGFYEELDLMVYFPKDAIEGLYYGNDPFFNRSFSISQAIMKADLMGVLHAGISKKIDEKLTIGGRFKIYSSSLNVETNNNSGSITTTTNNTNITRLTLQNLDAGVSTSGIDNIEEDVLSNTFLGGNLGIGFDVGLTYHFSPQIEFTGSILDLGFVKHSKNTRNFSAKGNYVLDGINFEYNSDDPIDYWKQLEQDIDARIPNEENEDAYTSWRPMKLNAALKYSFGERRNKFCYTKTHKQYYYNSIGFQIHTIMRPLKPQFSFTSFYEKSLSQKIHTKFTHTINDYSSTIFGAGASLQLGKLHVFGALDNVLGVRDLSTLNTISLNFGLNIIIN
jgi:hypothetical protein